MRAPLLLPLALRHHARATPESTAIVEPGRAWSFAALDALADALAAGLTASGVGPGDRVALVAAPSATAIALLVATARVGACAAPLGTRLPAPELAAAGREILPRLVVHDGEHATQAAMLGAPTVPLDALGVRLADDRLAAQPIDDLLAARLAGDPAAPGGFGVDAARGAVELDPDAPAVAVLTSGTAGRPKVALLSHAALGASAASWSAALPPATGWLLCLGLAHVAGLGVAWRAIGAGVPLHIIPVFDPIAVLEALLRAPDQSRLARADPAGATPGPGRCRSRVARGVGSHRCRGRRPGRAITFTFAGGPAGRRPDPAGARGAGACCGLARGPDVRFDRGRLRGDRAVHLGSCNASGIRRAAASRRGTPDRGSGP